MKIKKLIIGVIIMAVLILVSGAAYIFWQLSRINKTELPKTNEELGIIHEPTANEPRPAQIPTPTAQPEPTVTTMPKPTAAPIPEQSRETEETDIENIVLFGVDRRNPNEASRSDTIMVISLDRKNKRVKVTSLMRDMYVPIPGKVDNRINAAYAFGGPALAVKTINSNFDMDIREYVTVDFTGFENIIDVIGGVQIDVKENEVPYCYVKGPGLQILNGKQALAYSRIRHTGNSDYERTERQRRVLNEIFKKIKSRGVLSLPGIVSKLIPYVETSLSSDRILKLTIQVNGFDIDSIDEFRLPVNGYFKSQTIRGMAVLVPNIEENKKRLHEFIYGTN